MLKGAVVAVGVTASLAAADITFGPYTFDDDAFADTAVANEPGDFFFNTATSVEEALVGFSPTTGLYNIGSGTNVGDFTVGFTDLYAVDGAGADILLFDVRHSGDDYEVALVTGSGETGFIHYPATGQVDTGVDVPGSAGSARAWAIEIDLASYGVSDAIGIRFRSFNGPSGEQGDPIMAGVVNGVPSPGAFGVLGVGGLVMSRRRR